MVVGVIACILTAGVLAIWFGVWLLSRAADRPWLPRVVGIVAVSGGILSVFYGLTILRAALRT
jgi:hypothetical protein